MSAREADRAGHLIIVGGPPASGKSTLARRLREQTGGLIFEPDAWLTGLALDRTDDPTRQRVEALQWQVAAELLERGETVILDWGVFGADKRARLRDGARERGARVELHFLDAPRETLWRRIVARDDAAGPPRAAFEAMLADLQPPTPAELATFDASARG